MYNVIDFLNQNSGAITVILTLILAFINIFQWRLARKLRIDANRPKILANIEGINGDVYYKLANYGSSSAINLRINIDSRLINCKQKSDTSRLALEEIEKNNISILPNSVIFIPTYESWSDIKEHKLSLSYTYKDLYGETYYEQYSFDLAVLNIIETKDHYELEERQQRKGITQSLNIIAGYYKKSKPNN